MVVLFHYQLDAEKFLVQDTKAGKIYAALN